MCSITCSGPSSRNENRSPAKSIAGEAMDFAGDLFSFLLEGPEQVILHIEAHLLLRAAFGTRRIDIEVEHGGHLFDDLLDGSVGFDASRTRNAARNQRLLPFAGGQSFHGDLVLTRG